MGNRKVRIGIDVGGTFTDAVVVDNDSYEIVAKEKIPTTHDSDRGVADGIVQVIEKVLENNNISPDDVVFIAHGTTQATNALLEGDVARIGIIGMGSGLNVRKSKKETTIGNIELSKHKYLYTANEFINSEKINEERIKAAISRLKAGGAEVIVASECYSVDNPSNELKVINIANEFGLRATGGHEMSQLYGLRARTRTASVNGALIPKMLETADMTESAVKNSGIKKPLMIMRCDGGVMSIDEVRKRPILTMLSGLAAGVAGALMYEKLTDGIFLEAGGTSTDISVIKDGKVMINNAHVGGQKLYLNSLDVRTLGIAGGSMIVVENGRITDVGPRSAHIAGKPYEVYADTDKMLSPKIKLVAPRPEDAPDYAAVECENGESFAFTLAGAANVLGYVSEADYAHGNVEAARIAWQALADYCSSTVEDLCRQTMDIAIEKVAAVVKSLINEYKLNPNIIRLVGGGGSASIVAPYLSEMMNIKYKIADNAPVISTIGVALALVREQIERNVSNPTDSDIQKIRHDVTELVTKAGAAEETVEVSIEVDPQKSILRAIATGATELRTKDRKINKLSDEDKKSIIAEAEKTSVDAVEAVVSTGRWSAYYVNASKSYLFGALHRDNKSVRVLDDEGVIRLRKNNAKIECFRKSQIQGEFSDLIESMTRYTDAGETLPKTYMFLEQRQVDLSGIVNKHQLMSLVDMELKYVSEESDIIVVACK